MNYPDFKPACDYCKGYSMQLPLYIGQWRFHPNNPRNPNYKESKPIYCPKCGPKVENEKEKNDSKN